MLQQSINDPEGPRFLSPLLALRAVNEAIIFRHVNVLKVLRANGACMRLKILSDRWRSWQPMQWAVFNRDAVMVNALLQANLPIYVENTGSHPLYIASQME